MAPLLWACSLFCIAAIPLAVSAYRWSPNPPLLWGHVHPAELRIAAVGAVINPTVAGYAAACFVNVVAHAWSRCLADGAASGAVGTARAEKPLAVAVPADDIDEAIRATLQSLSQDVTRHRIAAQTGRLLMFHAGTVSHPAMGASVMFVAPTGTVKTTAFPPTRARPRLPHRRDGGHRPRDFHLLMLPLRRSGPPS